MCAIVFALLIGIPGRHHCGRQAQFVPGPRRDGRIAHGLLHADFLVGPAADPAVFGAAGPDAGVRPASTVQYFIEPVTGFLLIDTLLGRRDCRLLVRASHLILPTIVLGTNPLAVIARMTRSAMLEVMGEDYIRTARAKGLTGLPRGRCPCAAQCA